jgi:hypothetical protein
MACSSLQMDFHFLVRAFHANLPGNLHRILGHQLLLRQLVHRPSGAAQFGGGNYVGHCAKAVEQHGQELMKEQRVWEKKMVNRFDSI